MKEVKKLYKDWSQNYDTDSKSNIAIITGEKMILPILKPKNKDKVLDIGCGTGRVTKLISKKTKKVIGIDFSNEMIQIAKKTLKNAKNIEYKKVDISKKLPFKDNSFDKVTAILVLNHIKYNKRLFKEIYRILKKDGIFIFDDFVTKLKKPFRPRKKSLLVKKTSTSEKANLIFGKGIKDYINDLHETNFEIEEIKFTKIDKTTEKYLTKQSYLKNKGRTLEAFYKCKKQ